MKISERIRRARRHAGLSQVHLSKEIAVQRSAVSNWESANDLYPTMANLVAIARACDVSLEWLGTGRGAMRLGGQELADIPTADAELVEESNERALLLAFRSMPKRTQDAFLDLGRVIASSRRR